MISLSTCCCNSPLGPFTVTRFASDTVIGPKGELQQQVDSDIIIAQEDGNLVVKRPSEQKRHKALHGLYRALLNNMVVGVTTGYKIEQELVGVGYRATNRSEER